MKKMRFLSLLLSFVLALGMMTPVSIFAEETGNSATEGETEVLPEILYEDHFDEALSYGGWANAGGGEASKGIIDDGTNKVYRVLAKKTSSSTGNADTVLQFKRGISGVFEMKFKVKMYSRGDAFKLLVKSPSSPSGHQWINVFANNGESFEAPVGSKISSISVDKTWHDFSVVFNTNLKTFRVTRDAVVICNSTIPENFDFSACEIRFQGYVSRVNTTVNAYIDDLYMIQHPDTEEYSGILYENSFDGTQNELLVKGRKGWATVGDSTLNEVGLSLGAYNDSDAIHSVAVRGAEATANADATACIPGGAFFAGEWKIEADITPIRTNSKFSISFREENKSQNYYYELFSADHGTYKACKVNMSDFSFVCGETYRFKFIINLYDNVATLCIDDKEYITDMPFIVEPGTTSKYALRIQTITTKAGDTGEYYIDNVSVRYKDIPKIVLNGNPVERISIGETYTDPGANVIFENHNVGIDALNVSGEVDTSKPGVSYLTYSAKIDGVAAKNITRKIITEPISSDSVENILNEDFSAVSQGAKGNLDGSWTSVNGDSKNYAYLGAVNYDCNRVLKAYTVRNNCGQADMEATIAKNSLNLNGLYKIDFDILTTGGEDNYIHIALKDLTNNVVVVPIYIIGNTLKILGGDNKINLLDNEWYGISIKVDYEGRKLHIYLDGTFIGTTMLNDNINFENTAFRVQNWSGKNENAASTAFYADNFSISTYVAMPVMDSIFNSGMMLQRNKPVSIYGKYPIDGTTVTVSILGQIKYATVENGEWEVKLDPMQACDSTTLTISADNGESITYNDVAVGEIWMCMGQSNMDQRLNTIEDYESYKDDMKNNNIRLFSMTQIGAYEKKDDVANGNWKKSTIENASSFSAIGYVMAEKLHKTLGVPVGLVMSCRGATGVDVWISEEILRSRSEYDDVEAKYDRILEDNSLNTNSFKGVPTSYYNNMVYPLMPYTVNGVIWYQGCSNMNDDQNVYKLMFNDMIDDLRSGFANIDMPIITFQLAPHDDNFMAMRQTQFELANENDNVYLVSTAYEGYTRTEKDAQTGAIHPYRKSPVAKRAAHIALNEVYNDTSMGEEYYPPYAKSAYTVNDKIFVEFTHVGTGLIIDNTTFDVLEGFEISSDGIAWEDAEAKISEDGKTVELVSDEVSVPKFVRYGYVKEVIEYTDRTSSTTYDSNKDILRTTLGGNLTNNTGYPAYAFFLASSDIELDKTEVVFNSNGENVMAEISVPSHIENGIVILSVYDGNKLIGVDFADVDSTVELEALDTSSENRRVSVIIVDNLENMRPLSEERIDAE